MARRQLEIAGTRNDNDIPLAVIEAGQAWLEQRREQRRAREKTSEALAGVIALMDANKVEEYAVKDVETGEKLKIKLKTKITLTATRDRDGAGEEFDIGDGVEVFSEAAQGPHPGLLAAAERAQADADAGVEQTEDGDIVTPDVPAPKAKKRKKKGAKRS